MAELKTNFEKLIDKLDKQGKVSKMPAEEFHRICMCVDERLRDYDQEIRMRNGKIANF